MDVKIEFADKINVSRAKIINVESTSDDEETDSVQSSANSTTEENVPVVLIDDSVEDEPNEDFDLPDFSGKVRKIKEASEYIKTKEGKVFKKSCICWALNDYSQKLSSDRLHRVKQSEGLKESLVLNKSISEVKSCDYITVGDLCLFEKEDIENDGRQYA